MIGQLKRYTVVPLSENISLSAAKISCDRKLPMVDSIIYATAKTYSAVIWTQDEDFKGLKAVKYFKKKPRRRRNN